MSRPSVHQYVEYLGIQPRTMGWGALLVYDRSRTNRLLAQEYIEHANSDSDFPAFNATEEVDQNSKIVMNGFRFGAPLLSFTNSNISSSRARLTMKIIEGQYLTLNKALGGTGFQVTSIAAIDALNSPSLLMDIFLQATDNGSVVDEEGQVLLDLSDGENHRFLLSSSEDRNRVLGIAIRKRFESWSDDKKRFVLSRVAKGQGLLQPTSFAIRTHSLAKSGQLSRAGEDEDDGAVIVGVAMNNAPNGNFPVRDSDLPYLLPESDGYAYGMNILLSNDHWFKEIFRAALDYLDKYTDFEYVLRKSGNGFLNEIDLVRATSRYHYFDVQANPVIKKYQSSGWPQNTYYEYQFLYFFAREGDIDLSGITMTLIKEKLTIAWSGTRGVQVFSHVRDVYDDSEYNRQNDLVFHYDFKSVYMLRLQQDGPDSGTVKFELAENVRNFNLTGSWYWGVNNYNAYFCDAFADRFELPFDAFRQLFTNSGATINALFLNNLLFKSHLAARPLLVEVPGDLSLLGDLAPEQLHFSIHPSMTTISANATLPFTLEGASNVQWSVELYPGDIGDKGTINSAGVYKAPPESAVPATGRRVKVLAKLGKNTTQAMVYITRNAVSVYPKLQVAQHSHTRYLLVAGSGDGKPVSWDVTAASQGSVRAPTSQDYLDMDIPDDQDVQIYVSPTYNPGPIGDWKEVLQLDQVRVAGSSGSPQVVDLLIPWSNPGSWFETEHVGGGIRLRMWTQGRGGPVEVPPEYAYWYVIRGNGVLTDGIYTPGVADQDYAIIAAIEDDPRFLNYAFMVLPFPLMDLKTLEMIDPALQAVSASTGDVHPSAGASPTPATGRKSREQWREWLRLDSAVADNGQPVDQLTPTSHPVAWFETQELDGAVRLTLCAQGRRGRLQIRPDEADWYVVKGDGVLKDGLYTPGPGDQNHAIVMAVEKNRRHLIHAYAVLPFSQFDPASIKVLDAPSRVS